MKRMFSSLGATILSSQSWLTALGVLALPWALGVFWFTYVASRGWSAYYGAFDYALDLTGASPMGFSDPLRMMLALLPCMLLMLIWGRYFHGELSTHCRYTMPRYGAVGRWYRSKAAVILLLALCQALFYWAALEALLRLHAAPEGVVYFQQYAMPVARAHLIALLFLRLALVLLLQSILHMVENQSVLAFAVPLVCLLAALTLGRFGPYFPLGATFLNSAALERFSLAALYGINLACLAALYALGRAVAGRRAFFLRMTDTH